MIIGNIVNGIVIDHIPAGLGMEIYNLLGLDSLECSIALIKNVQSAKMGKKDIIKIDADIDINMDILGYVAPGVTVNIIRGGERIEKRSISLPEKLTNVIFCKNPRCITSTEQELDHVFKLTNKNERVYRCLWCETQANKKK